MDVAPVPELVEMDVGEGLRLALHQAGRGPALVLIHGAGAGASGIVHFRRNIPAFVAAGYRVIVPDLIGYGGSSKPVDDIGYPLERFTDTLARALDELGVRGAGLFGNSLGGAIAMDLALRRPDLAKAAVLLAPGALEESAVYAALPIVQKLNGIFAQGVDQPAMRALLRSLVGDPDCVEEEVVAIRTASALTQPAEVLSRMKLPNLSPRIKDIAIPLQVFWGADDPICPVDGAMRIARDATDAVVTILSGVGHWPMTERADLVNRVSLSFLSSTM